MEIDVKRAVAAIVTMYPDCVRGGAPIFVTEDMAQTEKWASSLATLLQGVVHELRPGLLLVVKH